MFNCIVRSDYNLIVALVCYYFWQAKDSKNERISYVIKILIGIVQVFDVIWLIVVWTSWTGSDWASPVWNRLRFWHILVIITSIVNFVVKVPRTHPVRDHRLHLHGRQEHRGRERIRPAAVTGPIKYRAAFCFAN